MVKNYKPPPSFSLIKKDWGYLLLKDDFKDPLLNLGIGDFNQFLKKNLTGANFLKGRIPHPSISLKNDMRVVIRQYTHGGLFRWVTRDIFLLGSRSFRELTLTEEVRSCEIPTIEPIGAAHQCVAPFFYRSYLLSLEIPQAMDLVQYFQTLGPPNASETLLRKRQIIRSVGLLIRQFHQKGFFHGDLQLKNILIKEGQPLLIDFDRSYRKSLLSTREKMRNLLRLNRSIEKWKRLGLPINRTDQWRLFQSYAGDDPEIQKAIKKVIRTYSLRLLLYRLGWRLEK